MLNCTYIFNTTTFATLQQQQQQQQLKLFYFYDFLQQYQIVVFLYDF